MQHEILDFFYPYVIQMDFCLVMLMVMDYSYNGEDDTACFLQIMILLMILHKKVFWKMRTTVIFR